MRRLADSSRRGEEKKEKGWEEKERQKRRSRHCSNSKEHSRRTLCPLPSLSLRFLSSFSLFRSCGTGSAARDENSPGHRQSCHGDEKRIFFVLSSLLLSSLISWPPRPFLLASRVPGLLSLLRLDASGSTGKTIPPDSEALLFDELLMPVRATVE